jgi:hypothetical protein
VASLASNGLAAACAACVFAASAGCLCPLPVERQSTIRPCCSSPSTTASLTSDLAAPHTSACSHCRPCCQQQAVLGHASGHSVCQHRWVACCRRTWIVVGQMGAADSTVALKLAASQNRSQNRNLPCLAAQWWHTLQVTSYPLQPLPLRPFQWMPPAWLSSFQWCTEVCATDQVGLSLGQQPHHPASLCQLALLPRLASSPLSSVRSR